MNEQKPWRLVVVSAGTGDPSSTRLLADRTASRVAELAKARGRDTTVSVIDLRELASEVSTALVSQLQGPKLTKAVATLEPCPESEGGVAVRLGLGYVRGLGEELAEAIEAAAPFASPEDLVRKVPQLSLAHLEALATAGAFGCLGLERREALWAVGAVSQSRPGRLAGIVSRANLLHGLVAYRLGSPSAEDWATRAAIVQALENAGVRRHSLNVVVSGGLVSLWGVAQSQAERDAARVAAETTPGVRKVENHLFVFPPGSPGARGGV